MNGIESASHICGASFTLRFCLTLFAKFAFAKFANFWYFRRACNPDPVAIFLANQGFCMRIRHSSALSSHHVIAIRSPVLPARASFAACDGFVIGQPCTGG